MEINAFLRINESIFTFIFFFKEDFSHVKSYQASNLLICDKIIWKLSIVPLKIPAPAIKSELLMWKYVIYDGKRF